MSQFQPRASPPPGKPWVYPGHLKKLFKCPALRAIFVGKCPAPRSFCGGQMPGPPVQPINIQSYWLPYFNKHNCFSPIELHKTDRNESLRLKNDKANCSIAFIGLSWSINALCLLQNDRLKALTLSAVGNDDRMLRNKFVVVCKCPGGRDTINCQMPVPRDSS